MHAEMIPVPKEDGWKQIANKFDENATFPNCIGANDVKHITIIKPIHSGSLYFNYKNYFSIVLLALCDAEYMFTYVDIGSYGKDWEEGCTKSQATYKKSTKKNESEH